MKNKNLNAAPVSNNVDGTNIKENDMTNSTSGMVTITQAAYDALKTAATPKKPGQKATTSSKVWMCKYSKSEINTSAATPQMKKIMHAIRQESEETPGEWVKSAPIIERMLDDDNDACYMNFSAKYREASIEVKQARLVEVMHNYAHPDFIDSYELDRKMFSAK